MVRRNPGLCDQWGAACSVPGQAAAPGAPAPSSPSAAAGQAEGAGPSGSGGLGRGYSPFHAPFALPGLTTGGCAAGSPTAGAGGGSCACSCGTQHRAQSGAWPPPTGFPVGALHARDISPVQAAIAMTIAGTAAFTTQARTAKPAVSRTSWVSRHALTDQPMIPRDSPERVKSAQTGAPETARLDPPQFPAVVQKGAIGM